MTIAAGPAAAEPGDSAEIRPVSVGGFSFPEITGPTAPEEYPFQMAKLGAEMTMRQVGDQEFVAEYFESGTVGYTIESGFAHDAVGADVPTSLKLSEDEEGFVITLIIHYRAGNPAAGWEPFVFPITGGKGWEGGLHSFSVEMNESNPPAAAAAASPSPAPAPDCTVPSLRGLGLRAAKFRLRADDCAVGKVHLAAEATAAKGEVVKQFRAVGLRLAGGAPVGLELAPRQG